MIKIIVDINVKGQVRTEYVIGYCSQVVPISAGSTKRCEVWYCPDGR